MPRKSLLTHIIAGMLIICVMVLAAPAAFAVAPVADQQNDTAVESQTPSLKATIFSWFATLWDKFLVFPVPNDPTSPTGGGTNNTEQGGGGGGDSDPGPGIDP